MSKYRINSWEDVDLGMDEGIGTKEVLEVIKAKKINISVITLLFTFLSILFENCGAYIWI